jgi:hypothetical protein
MIRLVNITLIVLIMVAPFAIEYGLEKQQQMDDYRAGQ